MLRSYTPFACVLLCLSSLASAAGSKNQLRVEFLRDNLVHFEWTKSDVRANEKISMSPMIRRQKFPGASVKERVRGDVVEYATPAGSIALDKKSLTMTILDKSGHTLTTLTPLNNETGFSIDPRDTENIYGLGQQFTDPGNMDHDWVGYERVPGGEFGNAMVGFNGGFNPNTQIPIMYAAGSTGNYAIFMDDYYPESWNFKDRPWKMSTKSKDVRGFVFLGDSLGELRRSFMNLVGHPILPPKKLFGFWISEWGYDNWAELDDKLKTLKEHQFPIDGAFMDLQWFGGIDGNNEDSQMGRLDWDTKNFPEPKQKITGYDRDRGLGIIVIEESYVAKGLHEHKVMEDKGFLARDPKTGLAAYLKNDPWWGLGGMIDWTNPDAAAFWHDWKRQPLLDMGVLSHWTDLGEPELYDGTAVYHGFENGKHTHADVHNMYNFFWTKGIYDGYERHALNRRPYNLSRSGAAGMQRYGGSLWSADIAANLSNYRTHINVFTEIIMSGFDYYGSDTGGFYREPFNGPDYGELFTQWWANSTAFDIPLRVHTKNLCNCYETAPDRNGDIASNRDNLRQRYELIPYYYSLAHEAYLYGEPIVTPMFLRFQHDENVRRMSSEKMVGDLLIASVAEHGAKTRDVYLPAGTWTDYFTNEVIQSPGVWVKDVPVYRDGLFKLPVFARAGAVIPKAYVDGQTVNAVGRRWDGTRHDELILRVYPSTEATSFTVYEDDGITEDYRRGHVAKTTVHQRLAGSKLTVTIEKTKGTYTGAPADREYVLEIPVPKDMRINEITLDGVKTLEGKSGKAGLFVVKTGRVAVDKTKKLELVLGSIH